MFDRLEGRLLRKIAGNKMKKLPARIKSSLKRRKIDALLVSQPENRRYLSGYSGADHGIGESAGFLLIPAKGEPFLLTDSRFKLQAEKEAAGFNVTLYPRGLHKLLQKLLPSLGIKKLAFESHYTLHSTALALEKMATKINIEIVGLKGLVERYRTRKTADEISLIQRSVTLNEEIFQEVYKQLQPGMTERHIARLVENLMVEKGAEQPSFPTIVAGGPNAALPHAVPSARPVREGETVVIDMGLVLEGYCSDMTRTIVLGCPDNRTVELFRLVRKAQMAGMAAIKAGVTARDVDLAARKIIKDAGYGDYFGHGLGHGVGLAVHEAPSLSSRNRQKLQAGMVVTVEPGIYIPDWGGIRLENMVVVKESGFMDLNQDRTFLDI